MSADSQDKFITEAINAAGTDSRHIKELSPSIDEFHEIYQRELLYAVFQPVVDVARQNVFGYEALIRGPQGSAFEKPLTLFTHAKLLGLEVEFEILCRKIAIREFAGLALPNRLFINISPSILMASGYKKCRTVQFLNEFGVDPERVVIEVTEHQQTSQYGILNTALRHYRNQGFLVALDDLGAGYSSLRLWNEVLPDFIKIDKHFIRDVHQNKIKQSFIKGLLEISAGSNCKIIAEGIEKQEEYQFLHAMGLCYLQGFYFAKPAARPVIQLDKALFRLNPLNASLIPGNQDNLLSITRNDLAIPATTRVRDVLEMLQKKPELLFMPVVDKDRPVALVERTAFLNKLMQTDYGIALYGKQKISEFLDTQPVLVEVDTNLELASQMITSMSRAVQAFIVTDKNRYFGVSTVLDLLQKITQHQLSNARHANPLTLLPGIVPTNELINNLISCGRMFAIIYFDLDNFKPYNDQYGYDAGDKVIKKLAEVLGAVYSPDLGVIGHIGGDDFVVVDISADMVANCENVLNSFSLEVPGFYTPEHIAAGGINGCDRLGNATFFPLLSISAGIVPPAGTAACQSSIRISDLACEAKKQAKARIGNAWFINDRVPR